MKAAHRSRVNAASREEREWLACVCAAWERHEAFSRLFFKSHTGIALESRKRVIPRPLSSGRAWWQRLSRPGVGRALRLPPFRARDGAIGSVSYGPVVGSTP